VNYKPDPIGIHCEKLYFQSDYVPLISFKNQGQKEAAKKYIFEEVEEFFLKLEIHDIDINKSQLPYPKNITEKDFTRIDIGYFYENLFYDLGKRKDGKLENKIKWSITFDEKCTPCQIAGVSPNYSGNELDIKFEDSKGRPHRRYGTIDINGTPVFYYIYFTLQEILDVIKKI
jgi:hypothetical protein